VGISNADVVILIGGGLAETEELCPEAIALLRFGLLEEAELPPGRDVTRHGRHGHAEDTGDIRDTRVSSELGNGIEDTDRYVDGIDAAYVVRIGGMRETSASSRFFPGFQGQLVCSLNVNVRDIINLFPGSDSVVAVSAAQRGVPTPGC
jgi:hypothetical protein